MRGLLFVASLTAALVALQASAARAPRPQKSSAPPSAAAPCLPGPPRSPAPAGGRFLSGGLMPDTAPGAITVSGRVARIPYTLSGVACPAQVSATATLSGPGIAGKAAGLKLKAGAKNTITMKLSKAKSGKATFTIVLATNGRPTTEKRSVTVSVR